METDSPATPQSAPTDAVLIAAARRGETPSFRVLVGRHQDAGARLARRLAPTAPAELLSDAIASVNAGLRSGAGPRTAFRPHLLTVVRRTAIESGKGGRGRGDDDGAAVLGIDPALLAIATRAYRSLPESQQVALWHTEVDGDPLLDTGLLLGVSGTEIAELAFAGREAVRQALLESHLEKISAGPCRWTTDRMGAFVRARLNPVNTEKVATHLKTCSVCFTALPAVRLVETELKPLVATIVLGPAAAPYLGREVPRQVRTRRPVAATALAAAPAFLLGHAKAAAFVGLGAVLVTGGLVGGMNYIETDSSSPSAAVSPTLNMRSAQSQTQTSPTVDVIAESGSGVAGGTPVVQAAPDATGSNSGAGTASTDAATGTGTAAAPATDTAAPAGTGTASGTTTGTSGTGTGTGTPRAASTQSDGHTAGPTPRSSHPAPSSSKDDDSDGPTLHLGFANISITPGSGFLWLFSFSHGH